MSPKPFAAVPKLTESLGILLTTRSDGSLLLGIYGMSEFWLSLDIGQM